MALRECHPLAPDDLVSVDWVCPLPLDASDGGGQQNRAEQSQAEARKEQPRRRPVCCPLDGSARKSECCDDKRRAADPPERIGRRGVTTRAIPEQALVEGVHGVLYRFA
jgi:hypothetical protein